MDTVLEIIQKIAVKVVERGYSQDVWLVQSIADKTQELKARWRKNNT